MVGVENQPSFQVPINSLPSSSKNIEKIQKIQIIKIPKTDITITITTTIVTTAQDLHHILLMQTTLSQNWNINIQGGYKTKLIDIINYFDTHNFKHPWPNRNTILPQT
ncbi:hypothetical protein RIR_jg5054.t1 [Rhizophagus irregularis DAOM 181602=DAOM 197198]|nr:hypothetical protein RIR_jg5054.t1 [Rhizophagus irregularis DAOM 181602=DAOM 197198]